MDLIFIREGGRERGSLEEWKGCVSCCPSPQEKKARAYHPTTPLLLD